MIGDRNDVLLLWTEVSKRKPGRPEKVEDETLDNIQGLVLAPTGTSREAGLRKLQKAAAEGNEEAAAQLVEVMAGTKKVHTACVEAVSSAKDNLSVAPPCLVRPSEDHQVLAKDHQ